MLDVLSQQKEDVSAGGDKDLFYMHYVCNLPALMVGPYVRQAVGDSWLMSM